MIPSKHRLHIFIAFLLYAIVFETCGSQKDIIVVSKCCPLGKEYVKKTCRNSDRDFDRDLRNSFNLSKFELVFGAECSNGYTSSLIMASDPTMSLRVDPETGYLNIRVSSVDTSVTQPPDDYCVDYINEDTSGISAVICYEVDAESYAMQVSYGMIISMPFLLVTFLVYFLLPDRNLHQKALMFYVLSLLVAYILLVTINLTSGTYDAPWCSIFGYTTIFSFMVSFFWMNVICFDIWYTFSGGRGFAGSKRTSERKRLIVYGIYAFGMPALLLLVIYALQRILPETSAHNPGIGITKCFLADGWPNLWYFYGEAGLLVLANIIFFVLTALKIRKVKQETSMLKHSDSKRHSYEKDKQKFNLYLKLLFAMGVNWSMEVISWMVNFLSDSNYQYIFYLTDFFNAVYGVWIFFIFVFKKKIWTLLKKRYYNLIGKPHLAHTVTSMQTRTSNYSSTNYSTADTQLTDRGSAANGRQVPSEEMALRQVT